MFPDVTDREMQLPWWHERFKLRDDPQFFETGMTGQEGNKRPPPPAPPQEEATGSGEGTGVIFGQQRRLVSDGPPERAQAGSKGGVVQGEEGDAVELEGPLARALAVRHLKHTAEQIFPVRAMWHWHESKLRFGRVRD